MYIGPQRREFIFVKNLCKLRYIKYQVWAVVFCNTWWLVYTHCCTLDMPRVNYWLCWETVKLFVTYFASALFFFCFLALAISRMFCNVISGFSRNLLRNRTEWHFPITWSHMCSSLASPNSQSEAYCSRYLRNWSTVSTVFNCFRLRKMYLSYGVLNLGRKCLFNCFWVIVYSLSYDLSRHPVSLVGRRISLALGVWPRAIEVLSFVLDCQRLLRRCNI